MFRLKDSMESWKVKLYNSNSFTSSDIEELESHLLDEIDILKNKDLSEEEAFYIACSRLGSVELLSSEFTKINTNSIYLKRVVWFLGGYILISFIQKLITIFSLFLTTYIAKKIYAITTFNSDPFFYLNLTISIVISIIFLYFLFSTRYQLLLKIQSVFNYLFTFKKFILMLLFIILIIMNSLGFTILQSLIISRIDIVILQKMMMGENIFIIIWSMILCMIFLSLTFRKSK